MFWIRWTNRDFEGNLTAYEQLLNPTPTEVEYPEARAYKQLTTQDGTVVVQRPLRDSRPRKWTWRGHGNNYPGYAALWDFLTTHEYRNRISLGLPGYVEVWEDVTGAGGFDRVDKSTGEKIWTKVKLLQVTRTPSGGGPVSYETSVTFFIDDPDWTAF